jgi:DNA-binding LacI/PurR family transcriptional regulator
MRLMGQMAARWAIDLVTENDRPASHRLQVRLVVRNSSMGKGFKPTASAELNGRSY